MPKSDVAYWSAKLDKIQYALSAVRRIMDGAISPEDLESFLEQQEDQATKDLIEAEEYTADEGGEG